MVDETINPETINPDSNSSTNPDSNPDSNSNSNPISFSDIPVGKDSGYGKLVIKPTTNPTHDNDPDSINEIIHSVQIQSPLEEAKLFHKLGVARTAITENAVGLSRVMRRFLAMRAICETDVETCKQVNITAKELARWQEEVPQFARAYGSLFVDPNSLTTQMLDSLLPKGVDVLNDLLDSGNNRDRARGVELLFKSRNLFRPDTGNESASEFDKALIRRLLRLGQAIPPELAKVAQEIEGEFREV